METRSSVKYAIYIEVMWTLEIAKINQRNEEFLACLYPSSAVSYLPVAEFYLI